MGRRRDHLDRLTLVQGKMGAQGFVARHDPVQRGLQGVSVQSAAQAQSRRNVISSPRRPVQLIEEPQALLRPRQRQWQIAIHQRQRRLRREPGVRHLTCQTLQCRLGKHIPQRHFDFEALTQTRHQLHRQ